MNKHVINNLLDEIENHEDVNHEKLLRIVEEFEPDIIRKELEYIDRLNYMLYQLNH